MRGTAFVLDPVFPSADTLGFIFYSINGRERVNFISMKTEAWTLLTISLPRRVRETLVRSETQENSTESQL